MSTVKLHELVHRRRIHETSSSDIDGLSDQLQSVSLAISAAMDRGSGDGPEDDMQDSPVQTGMEELRRWYQTEVFAASDAQQHRWEERRWAFLGQLQHLPEWLSYIWRDYIFIGTPCESL